MRDRTVDCEATSQQMRLMISALLEDGAGRQDRSVKSGRLTVAPIDSRARAYRLAIAPMPVSLLRYPMTLTKQAGRSGSGDSAGSGPREPLGARDASPTLESNRVSTTSCEKY